MRRLHIYTIADADDSTHLGAMAAAVDLAIRLDAVSDDATIAVIAFGRERVNRALETVERVVFTIGDDLEGFVVIIAANFAACYGSSPHKGVFGNARYASIPRKIVQVPCRWLPAALAAICATIGHYDKSSKKMAAFETAGAAAFAGGETWDDFDPARSASNGYPPDGVRQESRSRAEG